MKRGDWIFYEYIVPLICGMIGCGIGLLIAARIGVL